MRSGFLLPALLLAACSSSGTLSKSEAGHDSASGGELTETGPADAVTWYADIRPLLQRSCVRCHQPGGPGTTDLTDYRTASAMAEVLLAQIDAGLMPPPASDPACRDYEGSEALVLPEGARDLLAAWIEADTPQGDPADAVEVEISSDALSDPDVEVRIPEAYAPSFGIDGNEWRCFVVDGVPDEDYYITAMQAALDARSMVHHIGLYSVNEAAFTDAWRIPEGFDCYGGQHWPIVKDAIGVWAPGMQPIELPDGVGVPMSGGVPLLLEFHYYDPGDLEPGATDQSGYAFRVRSSVSTEAHPYTWGITDLEIPAGEAAHTRTNSAEFLGGLDYTLYTMWPHMHVLGDGFDARVVKRNGEEDCLVSSEGYSFDNQYVYTFREPYVGRAGALARWSCTWDNTASNPAQLHDPPQTVTFGPGSEDEMCYFYGLYSAEPAQPYVLVDAVSEGTVEVLDSMDDLLLDREVLLALDFGGGGAELAEVVFEADPGPAHAAVGPSFPTLPPREAGLQTVLSSLIYNDPGLPLSLRLPVEPGRPVTLQLMFYETYYSEQGYRMVDLALDGRRVVDGLDMHSNATTGGLVYTASITPSSDVLEVEVDGHLGGDGYAILSGLLLTASP